MASQLFITEKDTYQMWRCISDALFSSHPNIFLHCIINLKYLRYVYFKQSLFNEKYVYSNTWLRKGKFLYYCFFRIHIGCSNSKLHRDNRVADFSHKTALSSFCYSCFDWKKTKHKTNKTGDGGTQRKVTGELFLIHNFFAVTAVHTLGKKVFGKYLLSLTKYFLKTYH